MIKATLQENVPQPIAIRRLEVEDMPLVLVIDSNGNDQYELGRNDYLSTCK